MSKEQQNVLTNEAWSSFTAATATSHKRFRKRLLAATEYYHPLAKTKRRFTEQDIEAFAAETNRFIAETGSKPPFPDEHSTSARDNMGYWDSFATERDEATGLLWLTAEVEVPHDEDARNVGKTITQVSVHWELDYKMSNSKTYTHLIQHVGATDYPVAINQGTFAELSAHKTPIPFYVPLVNKEQKKNMSDELKKAFLKSLSLPDNADDKAIQDAFIKQGNDLSAVKKELDVLKAKKPDTKPKDKKEEQDLSVVVNELAAVKKAHEATQLELSTMQKTSRQRELDIIDHDVLSHTGIPMGADVKRHFATLLEKVPDGTQIVSDIVGELRKRGNVEGHLVSANTDADIEKEKEATLSTVRVLNSQGYKTQLSDDKLSYTILSKPGDN